jgi:hypothetical protein
VSTAFQQPLGRRRPPGLAPAPLSDRHTVIDLGETRSRLQYEHAPALPQAALRTPARLVRLPVTPPCIAVSTEKNRKFTIERDIRRSR